MEVAWRKLGSTVRFYRLRSNVNPLLGSTITRSKVVVIVAVVVYYKGTIAMQGVHENAIAFPISDRAEPSLIVSSVQFIPNSPTPSCCQKDACYY